MIKISIQEYIKFQNEYLKMNPQPLRYGQAFFNKFLTLEDEVDNLFYETDALKAQKIIFENYIDLEK